MHNSYPLNYPLTNDFKFPPLDRHYPGSLSNTDFVERRNGLAHASMNQPMTLSRHSNGNDYNAAQMQHDGP